MEIGGNDVDLLLLNFTRSFWLLKIIDFLRESVSFQVDSGKYLAMGG